MAKSGSNIIHIEKIEKSGEIIISNSKPLKINMWADPNELDKPPYHGTIFISN